MVYHAHSSSPIKNSFSRILVATAKTPEKVEKPFSKGQIKIFNFVNCGGALIICSKDSIDQVVLSLNVYP